ncbi:MAG: hypothetical protein KGJ32_12055 [Xanthomonadaceae bacterium]|nr:hypothetical protein [Xanthomonadaceae bacterium]
MLSVERRYLDHAQLKLTQHGSQNMNIAKKITSTALLWLLTCASMAHAGTVTYVYTDPQGTPLAEADASGHITATFDYAPYGTQALGTPPNGPGYTGHVNDPDTGLVYMQARYYDPAAGRFLSVDPLGPAPGNAFNFNRYNYTNNNPINHIDPNGRCPLCAIGAAVVVGAGIGAGTDYLVQKAFNPGKPVNANEVKVAAVLGAVSVGTGALAVAGIESGAITVTRALVSNAVVNGVAGGTGRAVQGHLDGNPATNGQIATAAVGNAVGTVVANGIGVAAGDFAQAASKGAAVRMSSASVDSPAGIGATIVNTTAPVGIGTKQSVTAAAASQAGQATAQGVVATVQAKVDETKVDEAY